jgi:hypothetical protein
VDLLENATPWGVVDTLRLACVDYVACVVPFGLRSTLFFGKDWWPYHYQYNARFFDQSIDDQDTQAAGFAQATVDPNAEPFFRRRPLLQAHYCHSGVNLIASEVEVTQEGWATAVQAIGSYAGTLSTDKTETSNVQFIDTDIFPAQQRMKLVQSGLYSTNAMRIIEEAAALDAGFLISLASGGTAGLQTNVLNNYAVGVLHDEVRQMYQGTVTMQGNAWIKPRDFIHFVDSMRQISGPAEVKEVTHSFSANGGFVTSWTPDCVAYAHDTQKLARSFSFSGV